MGDDQIVDQSLSTLAQADLVVAALRVAKVHLVIFVQQAVVLHEARDQLVPALRTEVLQWKRLHRRVLVAPDRNAQFAVVGLGQVEIVGVVVLDVAWRKQFDV